MHTPLISSRKYLGGLLAAKTAALSLALLLPDISAAYTGPDYAQHVDPMGYLWAGMGYFQGANLPFGMMLVDPFNKNGLLAYSFFMLSGAQGGNLHVFGNFAPSVSGQGTSYQSSSTPGYHHVKFTGLETEITATCRTAYCRFTFAAGAAFSLTLVNQGGTVTQIDQNTLQCSYFIGIPWVAASSVHPAWLIYKFKQPISALTVIDANTVKVTFATAAITSVEMKVAESFFDFAHAQQSLDLENPGWNFDTVRIAARSAWNTEFSRLAVEGADSTLQLFYTVLFRCLIQENVYSEIDGSYKYAAQKATANVYLPGTASGYTHYANISGWDIWRTWDQLMGFAFTDRANEIAQGLVVDGQHMGRLPVWTVLAAETDCMSWGGLAGPNMLAGLYAFGAQDFALKAAALPVMLKDTTEYVNRYKTAGSNVVESAASLFCLAQYALRMGDSATYNRVMKMALLWKDHYSSNGISGGGTFVEGDSKEYSWMIPWDMQELIQVMGGPAAAEASMDAAQMTSFLNNEPAFHLPFLYNWIGKPWKTQKAVHDVYGRSSTLSGNGGDDDLGAMSSWYIWTLMGIYPAIYAIPGFTIHAPSIPKVTIAFGKGGARKLTIIGQNASNSNFYVQSVTLNGQDYRSTWLPISLLDLDSNTLIIACGSSPNINWGNRPQDAPPSLNFDTATHTTSISTRGDNFVQSGAGTGQIRAFTKGNFLYVAISDSKPYALRIYDMAGTTIKTLSGSGTGTCRVPIAGNTANFYLISILTPDGTATKKVIAAIR